MQDSVWCGSVSDEPLLQLSALQFCFPTVPAQQSSFFICPYGYSDQNTFMSSIAITRNTRIGCYARTYCGRDEEMYLEMFALADKVMNTYQRGYPNAVPIDRFCNARNAGIHKVYTEDFDSEIIELFRSVMKQNDIALQKHCSKSYVSKLIQKHR